MPPLPQLQDGGGLEVDPTYTVLLFLWLFLRCPPGQEAWLGCILKSRTRPLQSATGVRQQPEGQGVSLPLMCPSPGLSEV